MIRSIEDFKRDWAYEVEATGKVINALTDETMNQKVSDEGRSVGFLAWHLTQTLGEMLALAGLTVDAPGVDDACPASVSEIAAAYATAGESVSDEVVKNWTDETLLQEDNMYGETWKRGLTLLYMMLHQAHHRGQMTVLMRQAGIAVPGIYGPAKEEWAAMGAPTMP